MSTVGNLGVKIERDIAVAALMDTDAGARIEQDLAQFKQAIESGRLAA